MTSSFTSVPLSFDDNKTNKTNNTPSFWQERAYQQDSIYNDSRPVETPPSASFSSGLQFQHVLNPNPDTADRWVNAKIKSSAPAFASSPSYYTTNGQRGRDTSSLMNPSKQTQEETRTSFGFSAPSLSEKVSMFPAGHNPTLLSASSSSMLGLRQRKGVRNVVGGNPPPKRSMMNMKMEMNTTRSLDELPSKGMNVTARTSKAPEKIDDSFLLSDYNKENDIMGNNSFLPIMTSNANSGTLIFSKSTLPQEQQHQQQQQQPESKHHTSMNPFYSGQLDYGRWVVLYGFTSPSQCLSILRTFGKFGTIVSKYPSHPRTLSTANWICIQYESSIQADKALCQHGTFLDMKTDVGSNQSQNTIIVVGVMRMDNVVAERLGLMNDWNGMEEENVKGQSLLGLGDKERSISSNTSMSNMDAKEGEKDDKVQGSILKTRLSERDVLLTGNERVKRGEKGVGDAFEISQQNRQGLLYKILAWIFEW